MFAYKKITEIWNTDNIYTINPKFKKHWEKNQDIVDFINTEVGNFGCLEIGGEVLVFVCRRRIISKSVGVTTEKNHGALTAGSVRQRAQTMRSKSVGHNSDLRR